MPRLVSPEAQAVAERLQVKRPRSITIVLPHLPDYKAGTNGRNERMPWVHIEAKAAAREEALALIREQGWFGPPMEQATEHIIIHAKKRTRRDWDNLYIALKPVRDALVTAGVLVDDSAQRLHPSFAPYLTGCVADSVTIIITEGGEKA